MAHVIERLCRSAMSSSSMPTGISTRMPRLATAGAGRHRRICRAAGRFAYRHDARAPSPDRDRPCDSPFLPLDLVARFCTHWNNIRPTSPWPRRSTSRTRCFASSKLLLAPHLHDFLASGQRKIDKWYASLKVVQVRSTTTKRRLPTSTPPPNCVQWNPRPRHAHDPRFSR